MLQANEGLGADHDADLSAPIEELSRLTDAVRLQGAAVAIGRGS